MRKFLRRANLGFVASQRWLIDAIVTSLIMLASLLGLFTGGFGLIMAFWWLAGRKRPDWRQLLTWRLAGQSLLIQLVLVSGLMILVLPLFLAEQLLARSALMGTMVLISSWLWGGGLIKVALWASWQLGQTAQLSRRDFRIWGQHWWHFWWLQLIGIGLWASGCLVIWLWPASCVVVLGVLLDWENFGFNYSQTRLLGLKKE